MKKPLNVLFVVSECVPFAKTGGLADVAGALPKSLARMGHKVVMVMPKYSEMPQQVLKKEPEIKKLQVWMGQYEEACSVYKYEAEPNLDIYFVEYEDYYRRNGIYCDSEQNDYEDNPKRYAFLSQAAMYLCKYLKIKIDIVHSHDWQTAPALSYIKTHHWNCPYLGQAAGVLTIHNLGYQGRYPRDSYDYLGFRARDFRSEVFEDFGGINMLKGGIYFADLVNTVSPSYAIETLTPEFSNGLEYYLKKKEDNYIGILNGVDYEEWDPISDPSIPAQYSLKDLSGKDVCKRELQEKFSLKQDPAIPIIGIVSRMAGQKGLHLLADSIEAIVNNMNVQFAILGSGDKELEAYFSGLPDKYSGKIGAHIGYSNDLAHLIESGADFFLMPSLYEPCGLNQIYSLRYGTLPIVRSTGGLQDTVEQYNEECGTGTGFKFIDATASALYNTVGWAVSTYYDRKDHMESLIRSAMEKSFSWTDSAQHYVAAYRRAIENKKDYDRKHAF